MDSVETKASDTEQLNRIEGKLDELLTFKANLELAMERAMHNPMMKAVMGGKMPTVGNGQEQ